eukprot:TRINITY_DN7192_c0_g1_i1.p1 TRINITY_DN7192_c0_g1~~TRINITY_DN7192_c0_g1_i1.p1  ORF type:complete len:210 (+),score=66.73 TRINITY_DN7192_c0_g1_i1:141-770(+)
MAIQLDGTFSLSNLMADFDVLHRQVDTQKDINIQDLLQAYAEIYRLLGLFGKAMVFVKTDVSGKIANINEVSQKGKYATVMQMQDSEIVTMRLKEGKKEEFSGTRNLLRLVRSLDFFSQLLYNLGHTNNELTSCVQTAYENSMSQFHSFTIRKSAGLAFKFLPYRENFIKQMKYDGDAVAAIQKLSTDIAPVYNFLINSYKEKGIMNLP